MKALLPFLAAAAFLGGTEPDLASRINPFIGTGGHGHTYPGPALPFGMVQPGPDTRLTGWDGCSGYHFDDTVIYGFSQTHLSGVGCSDYGDILLLPATGPVKWTSGYRSQGGETPLPFDSAGYGSRFEKASEKASAGHYAVDLKDYGVHAEVTATLRTGLYRFQFQRADQAHILVDLTHRDELLASSLRVIDDHTLEGFRRSKAWALDQPVYFRATFSRPFKAEGASPRMALHFALKPGDAVEAQVALSAVNLDGAAKNLAAERCAFDAAKRAARAAWNRQLAKATVEGGTADQRAIFATALYHACLQPNTFQDVDGRYLGRDLKPHAAKGFTRHTVFSLWDTFRAAHPLYALVERKRTLDFIRTFLGQFQEAGRLPVWELWGNETDCMIGYHAVPVIVDAWFKGIRDFDARLVLKAMVASAEGDRPDLRAYRQYGFVPADQGSESVSKTLEYAYDDWCIARFAESLGERNLAARFDQRAQAWRHLLDPKTGFLRPRLAGRWLEPFDPSEVTFHYTEANGWQYGFFVPQDLSGFAAALGGSAALEKRLDDLFSAESRTKGREQADITGLVGQYAHGNEPSHHMAYLYAFTGAPQKTQAMVRRLCDEMYKNAPDGLIGNEDCGQMSAWYLLSALGFYAVTPGTADYVIGAPRFPKATLRFENGRRLVILAPGQGPYVQDLTLNGKPHPKAFLTAEEILRGGTLRFQMGLSPSAWGRSEADRPRTQMKAPTLLPAPRVAGPAQATSEVAWTLEGAGSIQYSFGTDAPTHPYTGPLALSQSATVNLVAVDGPRRSAQVQATFVRLDPSRKLTLRTPPHAQFRAGGDQALIDGLRGGDDFRLGAWQGFYGTDLDAELDLGEVKALRRLALGCLQDQNSWIFMPLEVSFDTSEDGTAWHAAGTVRNEVDPRAEGVVRRDYAVPFAGRARYVRARAKAPITCPPWHKGHPNRSFIFADELVVE
ncbi:MAG: glycoside hydrolase family 92 protein [Acidobacteria bacterium]|nr:glycoside hydrolase family 92 protein [Acidobacteriota bacterium]MBI3488105.1 glycoside hydrolase family 92 protein [Acidobacteriota bacterium]